MDATYTPKELARILNNAVIATKLPANFPIFAERLPRLHDFTKAFLDVPKQLITDGVMTSEELVFCLASAALVIQVSYSRDQTPKGIRDLLEGMGVTDGV